MADATPRQQIVQALQDAETILVAVNTNPSVDELSAALGFTLLANKMNKHATAVFSGAVPPAIEFLDPEKTFENTVDSLRDFIIALDKEKADHLRYKVDGDLVKIFITPYKTTISEQDLEYSQGDYNVEMVVAIGVRDENDLDRALSDHGRIMHDATVASLSIGAERSELGTLQWHDDDASSYSELLASLAEDLRDGKSLLDEQISTAFLTGIVAATERFSNDRTSSGAMTMSAQLMAAGANQQLIAIKLEEAEEAQDKEAESNNDVKDEDDLQEPDDDQNELDSADVPEVEEATAEPEEVYDRPAADGTMLISHEKRGDIDEVTKQVNEEASDEAAEEAERELSQALGPVAEAKKSAPKDLAAELEAELKGAEPKDIFEQEDEAKNEQPEAPKLPDLPEAKPIIPDTHSDREEVEKPNFGGVLNATSEQAAADKKRAELEDQNKTILKHTGTKYIGNPPANLQPLNSFDKLLKESSELPGIDPLSTSEPTAQVADLTPVSELPKLEDTADDKDFAMQFEPMPTPAPVLPPAPDVPAPTLLPEPPVSLEAPEPAASSASNQTLSAVELALQSAKSTEDHKQEGLPDINALPPLPSAPVVPPMPVPAPLPPMNSVTPPLPPLPAMPVMPTQPADLSGLPPLPPGLPPLPTQHVPPVSDAVLGSMLPPLPETPVSAEPNQVPQPADPNQFQIPSSQP